MNTCLKIKGFKAQATIIINVNLVRFFMQYGIICLSGIAIVIYEDTQNLNVIKPKRTLSTILVTGMDIDQLNVHVEIIPSTQIKRIRNPSKPNNLYP